MVEELGVPSDPFALAVGPEEGMWFTGVSSSGAGTIYRMSTGGLLTGEYVVPVGVAPEMPESSDPTGIVSGAEGDMWFNEAGSNQEYAGFIGRVTPTGKVTQFRIPQYAPEYRDISSESIAQGADGAMWFTDFQLSLTQGSIGLIGRRAPEGPVTEVVVPTGSQPDLPEASVPHDIALGSDGNLWFTDEGKDKEGQNLVGRVTPLGSIDEFAIPGSYGTPGLIARGIEGNMWFTLGSQAIGSVTPTGDVHDYRLPVTGGAVGGIALGPDGNMWFTTALGLLGRVTPAGSITMFARPGAETNYSTVLVRGPEGDLWYSGGIDHLARLTTPIAPEDLSPPVVSGHSVVGSTLSTSSGTWSHQPDFTYQWQMCDASGANCENLAGEVEATIVLGAAEVGHTLRAVVRASNIAGALTETSAVSPPVEALPPVVIPNAQPLASPLKAPAPPTVASSMTWKFGWALRFTIVESLVVHGVPQGGWIEVSCRGPKCPFAHKRLMVKGIARARRCHAHRCVAKMRSVDEIELQSLFGARRLRPGARISVSVIKQGWIGKSFTFAMRTNAPPKVAIECLVAGGAC